jgi:molybdopterin-guanine dinucleotide biosynthesis protein A
VARYEDLGRPLAIDAFSDGGPLAGLEAGLRRARTEWVAALACDMPRVEPSIFGELLERAERDGLDVCFLRCAVYRKTCLAPMRAALEKGERKVVSFLRFQPAPRAGELELAASLAINLNTPAEFQAEIGT